MSAYNKNIPRIRNVGRPATRTGRPLSEPLASPFPSDLLPLPPRPNPVPPGAYTANVQRIQADFNPPKNHEYR